MSTALAKGVIVAASVIVAAGIAAYENPQVREWLERSSQKLAMAIRSLGDDIQGRPPFSRRQDPSMREDTDERAEERRRQARAEIMERGRRMEEKRKQKISRNSEGRTPSFDSLVDDDGNLKVVDLSTTGASSAADVKEGTGLRQRRDPALNRGIDSVISLQPLSPENRMADSAVDAWESQYEQELRRSWNITLPHNTMGMTSSHASESLIDLTPTTEEFPDPDVSVPGDELDPFRDQSQYFSANLSQRSRTVSDADPEYYYAHPNQPLQPLEPRLNSGQGFDVPGSSAASAAGSAIHITRSELDTDDDLSDIDDGIRTPASAWTEVGSSVSGDA